MKNYNEINAHPRDNNIQFNEEEHIYTVNGKELISVTTLISKFFKEFDSDYWARKKAAERGVTPEVIKEEWAEKSRRARAKGTEMHAMIENYYKGGSISDVPADIRTYFSHFAAQYQLEPYRTEWALYDEDFGVAGTLDFLELKNGVFTLYDWKRSEKLIRRGEADMKNHYGVTGLGPIEKIQDTSYWHYALQLSMYRYLLEKNYGINVSAGRLVVFHPLLDKFYVLETPNLRSEVIAMLNEWK
ncbi:MAG: hypothetical protein Q4F34_02235 [Prevotellaceae bacterium]|nr:hypothetical protein [Prevotellaceae bacterium]